jgi:hypothetical protein
MYVLRVSITEADAGLAVFPDDEADDREATLAANAFAGEVLATTAQVPYFSNLRRLTVTESQGVSPA